MAQIAINFQPDHLFCTQPTDRLAPHASYPRVHKNRSRKERVYYAVRCQMFSSIRCWRQRTWKSKIPLPAKYGRNTIFKRYKIFAQRKFTGRLLKYTGGARNEGNARKWCRLFKEGTTMNDRMLLLVH